jgi:hypothetical protein
MASSAMGERPVAIWKVCCWPGEDIEAHVKAVVQVRDEIRRRALRGRCHLHLLRGRGSNHRAELQLVCRIGHVIWPAIAASSG